MVKSSSSEAFPRNKAVCCHITEMSMRSAASDFCVLVRTPSSYGKAQRGRCECDMKALIIELKFFYNYHVNPTELPREWHRKLKLSFMLNHLII